MSRMTREEKNAQKRAYRAAHKELIASQAKKYYDANREAVLARGKKWRENNQDKLVAYREANRENHRAYYQRYKEKYNRYSFRNRLKAEYGITLEQRDAMLCAQGGACAICGRQDFGRRGPCVDHDHCTGVVRGILCHQCNVALGHLQDDPELLRKAAKYLEIHVQKVAVA